MANKQDAIKALKAKFPEMELTNAKAEDITEFVLSYQAESAVNDGRSVFGDHCFKKKTYAARECNNPQTGGKVQVPAKTKVVYKNFSA